MRSFWLRKRNPLYLFLSFIFACGFGWFINAVSPDTFLMQCLFYVWVGLITLFFSLFVFANNRQALLITFSTMLYFFLRFLNLRHPFYLVLLVICLISIDLLLAKQQS
jgi:hypothetical protein